jgi:hypothetical protein
MELDELIDEISKPLQGQELDLVVKALAVCLGEVGATTGISYEALMQYACHCAFNQYNKRQVPLRTRTDGDPIH